MAQSSTSKSSEKSTAPDFTILCDDIKLSQYNAKKVVELMVESRLDLPSAFAITFTDRNLSMIDREKGLLREGVAVEISLGYDEYQKKIFEGMVSTVSAEMSPNGVYSYVAGFDYLHDLARGTSYCRYVNSDDGTLEDSLIAEEIIKGAGLKPVVTQTHVRRTPRTQDNCSDLEFLTKLAQLNGFWLYAQGEHIHFSDSPPNRGNIALFWGYELQTFHAKLSLDGLVKTLIVHGRDASLGENFFLAMERDDEELKLISKQGLYMLGYSASFIEGGDDAENQTANRPTTSADDDDSELPALNLSDAMVTSMSDADVYLDSVMRDKQTLIKANGSCAGDPDLLAGVVLEIGGTGRFDDSYLVTRAVHRYNNSGYTTEFEAMRLE